MFWVSEYQSLKSIVLSLRGLVLSHSSLSGHGSSLISLGYSALIEFNFSGFIQSTLLYLLLTRIWIPWSCEGSINDFMFEGLKKLSFLFFLKILSGEILQFESWSIKVKFCRLEWLNAFHLESSFLFELKPEAVSTSNLLYVLIFEREKSLNPLFHCLIHEALYNFAFCLKSIKFDEELRSSSSGNVYFNKFKVSSAVSHTGFYLSNRNLLTNSCIYGLNSITSYSSNATIE